MEYDCIIIALGSTIYIGRQIIFGLTSDLLFFVKRAEHPSEACDPGLLYWFLCSQTCKLICFFFVGGHSTELLNLDSSH